jgi:SAM-dependent methyltransferase
LGVNEAGGITMTDQDDQAALRAAGAAVFAQADVAASYYARQPYAPAAYETLLALVPRRSRALDVGCGLGSVARVLAERFDGVVALDPSAPMIAAGQAADAGAHPNIRWVRARAEDFEDDGNFDLVTAGSSIHWVDPTVVFPRLAQLTGLVAMLANDPLFPRPPPPCGIEAWLDFLTRWNARVGRTAPAGWRDPAPAAQPSAPHEAWIDVAGRERFRFVFHQSVADFVASCHARVSWPRQMMGQALAAAFDAELTDLLAPHADDGLLALDVITDLVWGAPRSAAR